MQRAAWKTVCQLGDFGENLGSFDHPVSFSSPYASGLLAAFLPVLALLVSAPLACSEQVLFRDDFDYSGWDTGSKAMASKKWEKVLGRAPEFVPASENLPAHILLSNAIFFMPLSEAPRGSFTISAEVLFGMYSRTLWFGLLDEGGHAGRCAVWCSAHEHQFGGQGWVQIRSVETIPTENREAGSNPNLFSTPLVPPTISGHQGGALAAPFAKIDLSWDDGAKKWNLFVDGKWITEAEGAFDPGLAPCLYFGGGTGALFRNISLSQGAIPQS